MKRAADGAPARRGCARPTPRVLIERRGRLGGEGAVLARLAGRIARRAGGAVGLGRGHEISLLLCDDGAIRRLNRRWRGRDRATDVLSFPLHVLDERQRPPAGPLGDIVISLTTARRAARQLGDSVQRHLDRLVVHGLLHLLGYDHERPAQARRMQRRERDLLER
jgi:probable rRNA maturation factor